MIDYYYKLLAFRAIDINIKSITSIIVYKKDRAIKYLLKILIELYFCFDRIIDI